MDTTNRNQRVIISVVNQSGLVSGQEYHLKCINSSFDEKYGKGWLHMVALSEFPDMWFDPNWFIEVGEPQQVDSPKSTFEEIQKRCAKEGRNLYEIITRNGNKVINFILGNSVFLHVYPKDLPSNIGEVKTIGRDASCNVDIWPDTPSVLVSRLHAFIVKTGDDKYTIFDCSANGTVVY